MNVEINWVAVLVATLASMVVGSIWYAPPVFGNLWMRLAGLKQKELEKNGFKPIIIAVIVSLITAYVLAHFTFLAHQFYASQYSFFETSIMTAFWGWLGFTAARFITHDSFEGRRKKLTLLNIVHELVTFLAMGAAIGLIH